MTDIRIIDGSALIHADTIPDAARILLEIYTEHGDPALDFIGPGNYCTINILHDDPEPNEYSDEYSVKRESPTAMTRLVDALADVWQDTYRRDNSEFQRKEFTSKVAHALHCATGKWNSRVSIND